MATPHSDNAAYASHSELQPTGTLHDYGNKATGALEKDLLASLITFMQPIIIGHMPVKGSVQNTSSAVSDRPEGKRFMSALKDLIKANVHAVLQMDGIDVKRLLQATRQDNDNANVVIPSEPHVEQSAVDDGPGDHVEDNAREVVLAIPAEVQPTELETLTLTKTRAHVFNNMPFRLLKFDTDGSNPRLIGREEIFRCILPEVQAETDTPQFQLNWTSALQLRQRYELDTPRQERMDGLVTQAAERGTKYAILSHTWIRGSPGDVVFSGWQDRSSNPQGYEKVTNFCLVAAREHGMTLGWLDTVCINKDSSSELDESIRSMYRWYRGSHVCITYLSETGSLGDGTHDSWFTRGWTLQELLAPKRSVFYNEDWRRLGLSEDSSVQSVIEAETTITAREFDLCRKGRANDIPLSRRMQMASRRQVSRAEDSLYSLLGLLDVDISIAYGEGAARALYRLFRELLATKKHVLDLFNRIYFKGDNLIPLSITRYSNRARRFDYTNWGTALDDHSVAEPIVLTHLGVRIQCLLIPSLLSEHEFDTDYNPIGEFSSHKEIQMTLASGKQQALFEHMLDKRLYLPAPPTLPITDAIGLVSALATYAVINHSVKNGVIRLPQQCIGIRLYIRDRPGAVGPSSDITLTPQAIPMVFSLTTTGSSMSLPIYQLGDHGMQLVTLYL